MQQISYSGLINLNIIDLRDKSILEKKKLNKIWIFSPENCVVSNVKAISINYVLYQISLIIFLFFFNAQKNILRAFELRNCAWIQVKETTCNSIIFTKLKFTTLVYFNQ